MLAGILLKLGGYGFIRVLIPILAKGCVYYLPVVDMLALVSVVYASLMTIRQIDLKKLIAYSSVAHMNVVVLGLFSGNVQGLSGGIFLMIAHGVVSAALFFLVGFLYDRYHTRVLLYYGGLVQVMPIFSMAFLFFSFANIGLPGTCNFIGELMVFIGLVDRNFFILLIAVSGVILSVLYTMFLYNRVIFGSLNTNNIISFEDLSAREMSIIEPLVYLTVILGFCPNLVFDMLDASVFLLIEQAKF